MTAQHAFQSDNRPKEIGLDLTGYRSFGTLLFFLRENNEYSQQQVVEAIKPYLRSRKLPTIERRILGRLEKNERYPAFHELEPIYRAFVEELGISISAAERELYLRLARQRLEEKLKKKEVLQEEDWKRLAETLASIHPKRHLIHLLGREETQLRATAHLDGRNAVSMLTLRRVRALEDVLKTDTSHLLERAEWLQTMQAHLTRQPAKKLVVIQAPMGAGKSHGLALFVQSLQEEQDYFLVPYRFHASESKNADEQLVEFLLTLLADLEQIAVDETKQLPLEQIMNQVLHVFRETGKKVILLLDDAQVLFPSPQDWTPACKEFFLRFVKEPHAATIYLFTRIWPGWPERQLAYIAQHNLPELSPAAGRVVWQRFGFDDVAPELLEQASIRCGGNPQFIEMRAFHQQSRFGSTFAWGRHPMLTGGYLSEAKSAQNANTRLIEDLLAQDSLFDSRLDIKSRQVLRGVISSQLSHSTARVLECLAQSPLGFPFALLEQEFPQVDLALDELIRASLLDLNMAAADRASIVPLAREAQMQMLAADGRKDGIDQRVTDMYAHWLTTLQDFRDDSEKAALIAEIAVRYMRQRQLLKATELLVSYGWLITMFGHIFRIQRVYEEVLKEDRGRVEDANQEAGRLILRHRIAVHCGQIVERDWRDQTYKDIYQKITDGEITLGSHTELEVLRNMLLLYNRKGQLVEAKVMFDQALERFKQSGQITSEVSAFFAFDVGRLMSYFADSDKSKKKQYTQASVNAVRECITYWRLCLKKALPLQEYYITFWLARALNDLACDLRTLGLYAEAKNAIEESIKLKKKSGTPQHSIAIALSEYAQILAALGEIRKALSLSKDAQQILEEIVAKGDDTHKPELGLILKERADILVQQAHINKALALYQQAVELIGDKPLRQKDKQEALHQIEALQRATHSTLPYQLDRRWFARFSNLVDYNDIEWLTQAGPFTPDEQTEWDHLTQQGAEGNKKRKLQIIAQSRAREAVRSREAQDEPTIWYPFLALANVRERIHGLKTLRAEIEGQETNAVVRRLYLAAVDDHLLYLRLCEAYGMQDQAAASTCNLQLYGMPSEREMKIALQQLCSMLLEARDHPLAADAAQEVLAQIKAWGLSPEGLIAEDLAVPTFAPIAQPDRALLAREKQMFATTTIARFFQDVLARYGETDWKVTVSPARDHTSVDPNIRELILPARDLSVQKVRQLLAEEIEIHSYRAIAGRNSKLALLGSGLANHLAADEGLAYHYVQRVNAQVYGRYEEKRWNATLTTGFVAGVLTPRLSFPELRGFLEKMFVVSQLLDGDTWDDAQEFAQQAAWRRCCRVFRGHGCLSLKDRVYLQGHLDISDYLAQGRDIQRLYVGCVGIEHLEDMAELDILVPNYPHQQLALTTNLAECLASYNI